MEGLLLVRELSDALCGILCSVLYTILTLNLSPGNNLLTSRASRIGKSLSSNILCNLLHSCIKNYFLKMLLLFIDILIRSNCLMFQLLDCFLRGLLRLRLLWYLILVHIEGNISTRLLESMKLAHALDIFIFGHVVIQ